MMIDVISDSQVGHHNQHIWGIEEQKLSFKQQIGTEPMELAIELKCWVYGRYICTKWQDKQP